MKALLENVLHRLEWTYWKHVIAVVCLLASSILFTGLIMDDYVFRAAVQTQPNLKIPLVSPGAPFDLYRMYGGDRESKLKMQERGAPCWWRSPDFRLVFFRPLASFTLWVDFVLGLPEWAMHLHSFFWMLFMLWALSRFYRLLFSEPEAGPGRNMAALGFLAWLLFAIDDSNAIPLVWLSNRHLPISLGLCLLCLHSHERSLRLSAHERSLQLSVPEHGLRDIGNKWSGPLFFIAALLTVESTLSILGYLVIRSRKRLLALWPYALIVVPYLIWYKWAGYGAQGSGTYINPLETPGAFLHALVMRWPALLGAQLGVISTNIWVAIPFGSPWLWLITLAGALLVATAFYLMRPFNPDEIWLGAGAVLSLVPFCAIFPHDRSLLFANIGLFPIIARFLLQGARDLPRRIFWWFLLLTHTLTAVISYHGNLQFVRIASNQLNETIRTAPETQNPTVKRTVIVNGPSHTLAIRYWFLSAYFNKKGIEEAALVLSMARSDHRISRTGPRTVEVEADFMNTMMEQTYRRINDEPMVAGYETRIERVTVKVLAVNELGHPRRVRFTFDEDLAEYHWLYWKDDRYHVFELPPAGESIIIKKEKKYPYI